MKKLLTYSLTSVLFVLTACGGGGSSSSSSQGESVVTTTANATTPAINIEADASPQGGGIVQTEVTIDAISSITVSWAPPAADANGDFLDPAEITGYEIYYFSEDSADSGGKMFAVDLGTTTEMTFNNLLAGTYQFSIVALENGS
jgi:hypothetical protein